MYNSAPNRVLFLVPSPFFALKYQESVSSQAFFQGVRLSARGTGHFEDSESQTVSDMTPMSWWDMVKRVAEHFRQVAQGGGGPTLV